MFDNAERLFPVVGVIATALIQFAAIQPVGLKKLLATKKLEILNPKEEMTIPELEAQVGNNVAKNPEYLRSYYGHIFPLFAIVYFISPLLVLISLGAFALNLTFWIPFSIIFIFLIIGLVIKNRIDIICRM